MFGMSPVEWFAVATSLVAVWLTTRQNIWNWPIGIVSVLAMFVVNYRAGLYSDAGLQVVYVAMLSYGWYHWLHPAKGRTELPVTRTPARDWMIYSAIGLVVWLALGMITSRLPGASFPFIDAATTTASLTAQWMTTRKQIENWIVWIVTNVVYVAMYWVKDLKLVSGLNAVFIVLAVIGYIQWNRSLHRTESAPAASS